MPSLTGTAVLGRLACQRLLAWAAPVRVAYLGAQGAGNLGDEVIFALTRAALAPARVLPFRFRPLERRLATLRLSGQGYFRSVLLGGGTLMNPHWVTLAREALRLGAPIWTLGTGVGSSGFSHRPEVTFDEWIPILEQAEFLGVRGPLSQDRLTRLGFGNRVEVVGDPALLLARDRLMKPADPPKVLVNLAYQQGQESDLCCLAVEESVARLVSRLLSDGFSLVFVAMHSTDISRLALLRNHIAKPGIPIHHPSTGEDFLRIVQDCLFGITVRLHATVLARCAGVPCVMIPYRDKCIDFARLTQSERWCVDLHMDSAGAALESLGLELREQAAAVRPSVLEDALTWKRTLVRYLNKCAHLHS